MRDIEIHLSFLYFPSQFVARFRFYEVFSLAFLGWLHLQPSCATIRKERLSIREDETKRTGERVHHAAQCDSIIHPGAVERRSRKDVDKMLFIFF